MNIEFLTDYTVPVIVGVCLCIGYILKHWISDADNKIIPTACAIIGVVFAVWINFPIITAEIVLEGLVSGLAATGLHQAVTQFLSKGGGGVED